MKITLATCRAFPGLQESDLPFAGALRRLGADVGVHPWNGAFDPFAAADAVVLRSAWDYPEDIAGFEAWIARLEVGKAQVFNAPSLLRWNLRKTCLLDLGVRGAPLPPTRLARATAEALAAAMDALDLDEAVAKPIVGASARGLSIVRRGDPASLAAAAARLGQDGLVQGLIPEIRSLGETSFVFFGGDFSHAVVKRPAEGSILVQIEQGGRTESAAPPAWAVREAAQIVAMAPETPLYARIDAVVLDGSLRLMEVELVEPELFLTHDPAAAERFAALLLRRLEETEV